MSEAQLVAIALSTVPTMVVVMPGVLIDNARLNDVRDLLRAEMNRNQSEMLHRFGDLDTRLTRIENGLGLKNNG